MARFTLLALALNLALIAQVCLAQYAGFQSNGTAFSRGELTDDGQNLVINDLELRELKGVWQTLSDQYPQAVYEAVELNTMPDCTANAGLYNYARLDATAPQYIVLTGNTTHIFRSNVNLQRSTFGVVSWTNSTFLTSTNTRGVVSCTHWATYVDIATGEFMAESLSMTRWARNTTSASAAPVRTSLTCNLQGDEQVGCYSGAIARTGSVAVASTNSLSSPAGTVTTITKQTYICRNGECLRLSPKWAASSPAYGG